VKLLLGFAVRCLKETICFASVHAAALQPRRVVAWLEAALKLPEDECMCLARVVQALLAPQSPPRDVLGAPEGAAGLVPAAQWEEGARQLRRQVRSTAD
jgi:hypothetical protein